MFRNSIRPILTARRFALVAAPLAILAAVVPSASAADRDGWRWGRGHRNDRPAVRIHATIGGPIRVERRVERVICDEVPMGLQMNAYQSRDRVIVVISGTNRGGGFHTALDAVGNGLVLHNHVLDDCHGGACSFTVTGSICSPRELRQVCVRIGDRTFEVPVTCVPSLS